MCLSLVVVAVLAAVMAGAVAAVALFLPILI
jgi:hypothetical protein